MTHNPRLQPFTLIELLVVVAIIAVLASMLLPALSTARIKAKSAACMSQSRQIGLSMMIYLDNSDSNLPPNPTKSGDRASNMLTDYNDSSIPFGLGYLLEEGLDTNTLICPGRHEHGQGNNCDYVTGWPGRGGDAFLREYPNMRYFLDEMPVSTGGIPRINGRTVLVADVRTRDEYRQNPADIPHGGGANLLMYDGSVTWRPNAFGPSSDILAKPNTFVSDVTLRDRNWKTGHDYGTGWWYWIEKEQQGL